ncbi:MAG: serine hydrolase domain-containing protein [Phenylobacterium sp.]
MRVSVAVLLLIWASWAGAAEAQAPLSASTPMMLTWTPAQQREWYPAMETVFETRTVPRGPKVHPLPMAARQIAPTYDFKGKTWTVDDYMTANSVSGVLVLKDGKVLLERYGLGRRPQDRWTSFSVAKSITSTLAGAAVRDGKLKLTDPVTTYLPELKGSAYEGVSVRDLMTMSSGVAWNEDYNDPKSDIAQAGVMLEPGVDPYLSYVKRLGRAHPPGTTWHYNTSETNLMGIVVARAAGKPLGAYLSEKIWKPYGMERDAVWMVDRGGLELGGCCISRTLRDYGRVGQFMLDGGMAGGKPVLPEGWVGEATKAQIANGLGGYGYFWWIGPEAFEAEGIYGQSILVYPKDRLVVVINSAWKRADDDADWAAMQAFQKAVRLAAKGAP